MEITVFLKILKALRRKGKEKQRVGREPKHLFIYGNEYIYQQTRIKRVLLQYVKKLPSYTSPGR